MHLTNDGKALDEVSDAVDEGTPPRASPTRSEERTLTLAVAGHSEQAQGAGPQLGRGVAVRCREGQDRFPSVRGGVRPRQELLPRAAREANVRVQCARAGRVQEDRARENGYLGGHGEAEHASGRLRPRYQPLSDRTPPADRGGYPPRWKAAVDAGRGPRP
ncbi:hypothetical protein OH76DRAFT_1192548 [Lentinus brumalis]|uniref:Uncharacterized protein n=1 Tax=Lentinus brumalis TaxID=2498619 RepID=A0A371CTK9_9APHY|nr:hypothetical protein OH76DRAFT_1192548 [Polyporus brumalis]